MHHAYFNINVVIVLLEYIDLFQLQPAAMQALGFLNIIVMYICICLFGLLLTPMLYSISFLPSYVHIAIIS